MLFYALQAIASPSPTPTARNLQKPVITNDRPANLRCLKSNFDELTARLAGRAARENTWQSWAHDTSRVCHAIVANIYWLGLVTVAVVVRRRHASSPGSRHPKRAHRILRSLAWSFAGSEHSRTGPLTHMTTAARNLANLLPKSASNNQHAFFLRPGELPLGSKYPSLYGEIYMFHPA